MDLKEVKRLAAKKIVTEDIELFSTACLPEHIKFEVPKFHQEIYGLICSKATRIALAAPRGFAKSTVVSLVFALWCALTGRSKFIIIISDTYSQSKLFLETIKRELESNPLILYLFGSQITDKWAEGEIELAIGCKIMAKGSGMKMRGLKYQYSRPDLVILDDLENNELIESKDRRDKLERWFNAEVLPSTSKASKIVYVGTILHEDSLLQKVLHTYKGWQTKLYRAIMNEQSIWPERLTLEELKNIQLEYKDKGQEHLFFSEYMNEPMDDSIKEFKREYFKYFRDDQCPTKLRVITNVDLAISKKDTADPTCIFTIGISSDDNIYQLEYRNDRLDLFETVEAIFDHIDKFAPDILVIENVAYQEAMVQLLKKEMKLRNKFVKIIPVHSSVDKNQRIRGLLPYYRMGRIHHRPNSCQSLEDQLLSFPRAKHDDIMDALSLGLPYWQTPALQLPRVDQKGGVSVKDLIKREFN